MADGNRDQTDAILNRTALYRHFDEEGKLLYVGISLNALNRLAQHRDASHWFRRIASVRIEWFDSREAASEAEIKAICEEDPECNIAHKGRILDLGRVTDDRAEDSSADLTWRVARFDAAYSIGGVAALLKTGEQNIRFAMAAGSLPYYVIGRNIGVSGWALIEFVERLQAGALSLPQRQKLEDGSYEKTPTNEFLIALKLGKG